MSGLSLVAELEGLVESCAARLDRALALEELEAARVEYLGRKGQLAAIMSRLPSLDPDARREAGKAANTVKERLTALYDGRLASLNRAAMEHVPHAPTGFFLFYTAWRSNVSGIQKGPLPFFWGVSKS